MPNLLHYHWHFFRYNTPFTINSS